MEKLLITKANINEVYNIGANIDQGRIIPNIKRAQITDLQPILGFRLYNALVENSFFPILYIQNLFSTTSPQPIGESEEFSQPFDIEVSCTRMQFIIPIDTVNSGTIINWIGKSVLRISDETTNKPGDILVEGILEFINYQLLPSDPIIPSIRLTYDYDFKINQKYNFGFIFTRLIMSDPLTESFILLQAGTASVYKYWTRAGDSLTWAEAGTEGLRAYINYINLEGAIMFEDQLYNDLFYGVEYEYNGSDIYFRGIKPMLCSYAYARILEINQVHVTRAGVGNKESEFSTQEEAAELQQQIRNARGDAILLRGELEMFLESNISTYNLWDATGEKKTAFNITPVKGLGSIKQY